MTVQNSIACRNAQGDAWESSMGTSAKACDAAILSAVASDRRVASATTSDHALMAAEVGTMA